MREISLHLMDVIQNSIEAGADFIEISIEENTKDDYIEISVKDDGCGMNEDMLKNVTNPFVTSRKTRKVGLGLSLFEAACERCGGYLKVNSEEGVGTEVDAYMKYSHIDRAPMGRMEDTLVSALTIPGIDIVYKHSVDGNTFIFDSREIKKVAGDDLTQPEILNWIRKYIIENIEQIGGGA
jgi:anti-sigma regulatory factor (Ser/Thr protein kinase)